MNILVCACLLYHQVVFISCSKLFSIFSHGYGTRNTKILVVLATHGDGEPPKTLDDRYVKDIMHYFDNPEKTPFNYIMGVTLDQHAYLRIIA